MPDSDWEDSWEAALAWRRAPDPPTDLKVYRLSEYLQGHTPLKPTHVCLFGQTAEGAPICLGFQHLPVGTQRSDLGEGVNLTFPITRAGLATHLGVYQAETLLITVKIVTEPSVREGDTLQTKLGLT